MTDICLVSMPFEQLHLPSIGISLLVAAAKARGLDAAAIYPRFRFAEEIKESLKPSQNPLPICVIGDSWHLPVNLAEKNT